MENTPRLLTEEFLVGFMELYTKLEGEGFQYTYSRTLCGEQVYVSHEGGEYELMFTIFNNQRLIVKRAVINNTRSGVFTALVQRILEQLDDTPVTEIEVESALSPAMVFWCRKYNLQPMTGTECGSDGLGACYIGDTKIVRALMK